MNPSEQWVCGRTAVEITGLESTSFLNRCTRHNIPFDRVEPVDSCTMRLLLPTRLVKEAQHHAGRCGCAMTVLHRAGVLADTARTKRRIVLGMAAAVLLLGVFVSSLFIWDIQVTDNDSSVSDVRILRVLEEAGVGVGTFWPGLSSDMIRAEALKEIPELSWLAVNVHGSRAQVAVREAVAVPTVLDERVAVSVVAQRSGVIESIRTLEGEAMIRPGDAVLAGDVLVSAVRPGGFAGERQVRAQGEITARTWYELMAQTPLTREEKQYTGGQKRRFAMIVGKRRINFYFDSGILHRECDKITRIKPLGLENVFTLPLALVAETLTFWEAEPRAQGEDTLAALLEVQLGESLHRQLGTDGEIVASRFDWAVVDDMVVATLRAECIQRIDRETVMEPMDDTKEKPLEDTGWTEP